jgi:orotate phosphoribosyltransferase
LYFQVLKGKKIFRVVKNMENNFFMVTSKKNPKVAVQVSSGHFATGSAHRNTYIDLFELTSSSSAAREAARELSQPYLASTPVDVIIYMDNTEILAAYLADELLKAGPGVLNQGGEILLVTPISKRDNLFIFHQNVQEKIRSKNVVLLVATMSTGATANQVIECLSYYGCKLVGISAIFNTFHETEGQKIHSLFTIEDIPNYAFYTPSECPMCREGRKIDAIINSEGFTRI